MTSRRAAVGAGLIALIALAASGKNLMDCIASYDRYSVDSGSDVISAYEERFARLKKALLPRSVVGYISDVNSVAEYYLAQYTLSPVIVSRKGDENLVVGNFFRAYPDYDFYKKNGLVLLVDYGNGVLLFTRATK